MYPSKKDIFRWSKLLKLIAEKYINKLVFLNKLGWSSIARNKNLKEILKKKEITGCLFILIGIIIVYVSIILFNLRGTEINWMIILCTILIILIGLYVITGLKFFNAINSFLIGIWLLITPFKISILGDSIFLMLILFLPIGLFILIYGSVELMKDIT